jgi:hypothetical protein
MWLSPCVDAVDKELAVDVVKLYKPRPLQAFIREKLNALLRLACLDGPASRSKTR